MAQTPPQTSTDPPTAASAPGKLELKITSDPANLRAVRIQIEELARSGGLPLDASEAVGLVLNEALANIIRHGYHGATDRPILIVAQVADGQLSLQIRDWAKPFDPAKLPRKEAGSTEPGGLGLICLRKLMDEAEFIPLADGMLLKMVKRAGST